MKKLSFKAADFERDDISRLCDVVMKGGVTSGVVYPLAICKLATTYAVKNIGGTSVGAIAAAITAAAEYRRRKSGSGQGYTELAKLPQFLGRPGSLLALFAPDAIARAIFRVALIPIGHAPALVKLLRLACALLLQYVWIPLLTIAVVFGIFVGVTWPLPAGAIWRCLGAAFFIGIIAAFVGIGARFVCHIAAVLARNSFGWCHGYSAKATRKVSAEIDVTQLAAKDVPPLFNWLEAFIAQTAGESGRPLTFGDLWDAPQPKWHSPASGERCIDLRMVTTCLTLGRPFELPFDPKEQIGQMPDPDTDLDGDKKRPPIYFRLEDLEDFFSPTVVEHMKRCGAVTALGKSQGDDYVYYRFPAAEKLPIVVATRMSMSFPVIFCAFPLYALDATGAMQQLWFSDGGLSSNFPIHFFDSPLPRWPTFAIDLLPGAPPAKDGRQPAAATRAQADVLAKYVPGSVLMESEMPRGSVNPWNKLDRSGGRGDVLAFASAILDATRTWQDVTLGTLPGNASRIVGIRLSPDQGGLNLNMPPQTIDEMTQLGLDAGGKLVDVFASGAPEAPDWKAHRWLRYCATMGAITRWATGYEAGYQPFAEVPAQRSYKDLIGEHLVDAAASEVIDATEKLAAFPITDRFYEIEEPPIAVLPTRPVV